MLCSTHAVLPCVYVCGMCELYTCAAVHVKCLQTQWADMYDIVFITLAKTCVEMKKDKDNTNWKYLFLQRSIEQFSVSKT